MHFAEHVTVLAKAPWIRSSDLFKSRIQRTDLPLEKTGFSIGIFSFRSSSCKYWLKRRTAYFHMSVGKNPLIFSSTHLLVIVVELFEFFLPFLFSFFDASHIATWAGEEEVQLWGVKVEQLLLLLFISCFPNLFSPCDSFSL